MPHLRHCLFALLLSLPALAAPGHDHDAPSAAEPAVSTDWSGLIRMLTLQDHNTRVVLLGTAMLGLAAGLIGSFLLLRKRSLMGDAVSHATLPGICVAFLAVLSLRQGDSWLGRWLVAHDISEKSLPVLLLGALIAGLLGMVTILLIRRVTRLKEDVALGVVLSVFFGAGTAMLAVTQRVPGGSAAGLDDFIYGKAAAMLRSDAMLIAVAASAVVLVTLLLFKEFTILCFDQDFASSTGWPVGRLDTLLMGLAVMVTVIGLQSVGLILVIALLIIPPAAARFWTHRLHRMVWISGGFGAISGLVGAFISGVAPNLPTGALIVLVAAGLFILSLIFGADRGVVRRLLAQHRLTRKVARQNLLRAFYECIEHQPDSPPDAMQRPGVSFAELLVARSWNERQLRRLLAAARRDGLMQQGTDDAWRLTGSGNAEARRIVRNHRLWEMFLITHADIAPGRVDRDADTIEHVLGPELTDRLEDLLAAEYPELAVPPSPHVTNA